MRVEGVLVEVLRVAVIVEVLGQVVDSIVRARLHRAGSAPSEGSVGGAPVRRGRARRGRAGRVSEFRSAPGFWGRSEPFILGGEGVGSFPFPGSLGSLSLGFGPLPSILGPEIFHLGREGVAGRGEVR